MQTITTLTTASATVIWPVVAGRQFLKFNGTWGSGTLTVTFSEDVNGTFNPIGSGVTASADGTTEFDCGTGVLKFVLSGSTGASVLLFIEGIMGRASNW